MTTSSERKALSVELYEMTGDAIPESDPIITGALFFSYKLCQASRLAEDQIREAGRLAAQEVREAASAISSAAKEAQASAEASSQTAAMLYERADGERLLLLKAIDSQTAHFVKLKAEAQFSSDGIRYVPIWHVLVGAIAGAVALVFAWLIGVEQATVRAEEAAVGRAFARVLPTLEPKVRKQLMERLKRPLP